MLACEITVVAIHVVVVVVLTVAITVRRLCTEHLYFAPGQKCEFGGVKDRLATRGRRVLRKDRIHRHKTGAEGNVSGECGDSQLVARYMRQSLPYPVITREQLLF